MSNIGVQYVVDCRNFLRADQKEKLGYSRWTQPPHKCPSCDCEPEKHSSPVAWMVSKELLSEKRKEIPDEVVTWLQDKFDDEWGDDKPTVVRL